MKGYALLSPGDSTEFTSINGVVTLINRENKLLHVAFNRQPTNKDLPVLPNTKLKIYTKYNSLITSELSAQPEFLMLGSEFLYLNSEQLYL